MCFCVVVYPPLPALWRSLILPPNIHRGEVDTYCTGSKPLLLIKAGDVQTNPGPTTTRKQVWIFNFCHRQIHGRKQISIMCNRIEH